MRNKTRIIQISGFRGFLMAVFVVTCLAAGFVAFPSIVAMKAWNFATNYIALPTIGIWQGVMLWAIVALTGFILNDKGRYLVSFSPDNKLSEAEMKKVLERVKRQAQLKALDSLNEIKEETSEKEKENV